MLVALKIELPIVSLSVQIGILQAVPDPSIPPGSTWKISAKSRPAETKPLDVLVTDTHAPLNDPQALILPTTVNFSVGVAVPIPTLVL